MTSVHAGDVGQQRWMIHGLSAGLTGLFFGLLVSVLMIAALALHIGWVETLERQGVDATMRLAVLLRSTARPEPLAPGGTVHPITFIDIDQKGCEILSGGSPRCTSDGVSQAKVLVPIGQALLASKAVVVVLDIAWPEADMRGDGNVASAMLDAWAAGDGPPVVASLPSAPGQGGVVAFDWRTLPGGALRAGRLRYGSATFNLDPAAGDMVVRDIPSAIPFAAINGTPGDGEIASLPALAARIADGKPGVAGKAAGAGAEKRFFFSLPSLANPSARALQSAYVGNYDRRLLSKLLIPATAPGAPPTLNIDGLAGHIVIVGSSAAAAQDWHLTPLGAMPGAEIVANAIRAAQAYPPLHAAPLLEGIGTKVIETLVAAAIMTVAWLVIAYLRAARERAPHSKRRYRLWMFLAFLAGSVLTFTCNLSLNVAEMIDAPRQGHTSDILLPTLGVMLEGFVDFAKWITDKVEEGVVDALVWLQDRRGNKGEVA